MYLKKVEIRGFKSFADKIEVDFKEGITAIVGPNGSGKSNIADAIRWALGEQSIKTLRGSKMEDVIFSGTDNRKPLGYAEVNIIFDNKDEFIPIDYQEVAITRRVFRSGESEYYLNKNPCRLKDIKELFMDTGVGKDGYSIIGQGKVDEILSTKPEDRRIIFEEAAGIVKYKSKKEEAKKKLEKTQDNLIRLKDIIAELERQAAHLKEQSEKANIFLQLSNNLKELEVNIFIRDIEKISEELELIQKERTSLINDINEKKKERENIESQFNLMKSNIESIDFKIDKLQNEKMELLNKLNECKNRVQILEEKQKFFIKDVKRLTEEIDDLKIHEKELIKENENINIEIIDEKKSLETVKAKFEKKEIELKDVNNKIKLEEKKIDKEKDKIITSYNKMTDIKSKINNLESFEENIYKRMNQLEREIKCLKTNMEEDVQSLEKVKELEAEKKKQVLSCNRTLTDLKLKDENYSEQLNDIFSKLNDNKVELQGKISNYNLLKNMQNDYEGYFKSVKNLMIACKKDKKLKDKLIGLVADLIKVDEKYEKAIDVALGGSLQNIVTANEEDAKFIIEYLRKNNLGRITFLPLTTIKGDPININAKDRKKLNIIGLGSELVEYDTKYKNIIDYLLGRSIVVNNLDDATLVANRFNYRYKIVTLEGDIINAGGSMTGGSMNKSSGKLLNRNYILEKLRKEINILTEIQRDLEKQKNDIQLKREKNIQQLNYYEKTLQDFNVEVIKLENEKNNINAQIEKNHDAISKFNKELDSLNQELKGIKYDREIFEANLNSLESENEGIKDNVKNFMKQFECIKNIKEQLAKELTDLNIQINLLENKLIDKEEKYHNIQLELNDLKEIRQNKKLELNNIKNEIENIKSTIDSVTINMQNLTDMEKDKNNKLKLLQKDRTKEMEGYYVQQKQLKNINDELDQLEKIRNKLEVKKAKYMMQLENVKLRLKEDYELSYEDALDMWIEIEDMEYALLKVERLKKEIKELGTVNLNSIEEYKITKERLEFITKQMNDLIIAKADLKKVIEDMDIKMREQFLSSFNEIKENFNQIFKVLFNGGKADLIIEDEDNILNSGIDIIVQPPGKKLQNLSLLSGGEKSLTAVALLFAILQTKPTPFCILDEIDAALDEANINRYTNYLKSLSKDTQFIIITHRKSTMEIADVLYGVTMEEEGVSKVVSVKLTEDLDEIAS
ncbi:condensin subunit Smc [Keratinibaculum paraultunense]|uniref:Chromosome partition protein Smc n=1 Tax=Keratinibaculum paraultunense TaxID=1278232 RepID=A0A4R3KVH5_9FIRM|nr:chromosome segregation protein SMC [Keratinibaculum paraultunense]QQY80761.1 chromosome segregation protein SMC [Keratinibaculum paraultunense]TCS89629.1 condensin subunit Smc [Keratinibaculum paraultunense]